MQYYIKYDRPRNVDGREGFKGPTLPDLTALYFTLQTPVEKPCMSKLQKREGIRIDPL